MVGTRKTGGNSRSSGTLGVGVIGAGLMGGIHAASYARTRGCATTAYFNPTRSKAEALAKTYGGDVCDSVEELLAHPAVDAVCIASPQANHGEQLLAAAKAGKAIFAEKPVALTPDELSEVQAAVDSAGVPCMVGHQLRFHPVTQAVQKAMRKLGKVYHLDLEWSLRITADGGRCWENYRLGGFFMELGCHVCDLSRHLMGNVIDLRAHTVRMNPRRVTEDHTHCSLQFATGAIGSITISANHRTTRQGLLRGRVLGEKGRVEFSIYPYGRALNQAKLVIDHGKEIFKPDVTETKLDIGEHPSTSKDYPGFFDVYDREAAAFVKMVKTGKPSPCTLADGVAAVQMVLAAYDQQGQATRTPNFPGDMRYLSDETCHPKLG